ncbi:hypothetical protein FJY71_05365 [candidate division WOR-3 bacterium]|nr:hypothetical protein [candidate division WOR-3 bacterium]
MPACTVPVSGADQGGKPAVDPGSLNPHAVTPFSSEDDVVLCGPGGIAGREPRGRAGSGLVAVDSAPFSGTIRV